MTENDLYVEDVGLSQKIGRNIKGLMISILLILISATVGFIGIQEEITIVVIIGLVVAGISAVSFFVFFILFLSSIRKVGRTEPELAGITDKIFSFLFAAFFLAIAGAANSYSYIDWDLHLPYITSRIFGLLSLLCFLMFFLYLEILFKKFKELKITYEDRPRPFTLVASIALLMVTFIVDTIIRFVINDDFFKTLNYIMLGIIVVAIFYICFEMNSLALDFEQLDYKFNVKFMQLPPPDFETKIKSNSLMLSLNISLATFFSVYLSLANSITLRIDSYAHMAIIPTITPVISTLILLVIIFLIVVALKYQKFSQLSHKTANFGIIIIISLIVGPAVLLAGFFTNTSFSVYTIDSDIFLISKILMMLGVLILGVGVLLVMLTVERLKEIDKNLVKNKQNTILNALFPTSCLLAIITLFIQTIIPKVAWANFDFEGDPWYIAIDRFAEQIIWVDWLAIPLYTIVLAMVAFSILHYKNEINAIVPNYGKIPVKVKEKKTTAEVKPVEYRPTLVEEKTEEDKREVIEWKAKCSNCGAKLLKKYRFCPDCGIKFKEDASRALPKATYCVTCGEKLQEKYRFCPTCGSVLE